MTEIIYQFGYLGLFSVSFLAATLLPLASEVVVIAMQSLGYNSWGIVFFATAGGFLGSLTNYYVGSKGADFVLSRYMTIKPETLAKATKFYKRWGPVALFFSWVPFIGDPLSAVAGILHINLRVFTFWVVFGKILRNLALLGLANQFLGTS